MSSFVSPYYFLVSEYSHRASHGISLPGIRPAGQIMQKTRSMYLAVQCPLIQRDVDC